MRRSTIDHASVTITAVIAESNTPTQSAVLSPLPLIAVLSSDVMPSTWWPTHTTIGFHTGLTSLPIQTSPVSSLEATTRTISSQYTKANRNMTARTIVHGVAPAATSGEVSSERSRVVCM